MSEQKRPHRVILVKSKEYQDQYISNKPGRIIRAGGCEFHLFKYIDEYDGQEIIDLPRFYENPEYTDEGRPFVLTFDPIGVCMCGERRREPTEAVT